MKRAALLVACLALGCAEDELVLAGDDGGTAAPEPPRYDPVPSQVWAGPPTPLVHDSRPIEGVVTSTACAEDRCIVVYRYAMGTTSALRLLRPDGAVDGAPIDLDGCEGPAASDGRGFAVLCDRGAVLVEPDGGTRRVRGDAEMHMIVWQDAEYLAGQYVGDEGDLALRLFRLRTAPESEAVEAGCCERVGLHNARLVATEDGPVVVANGADPDVALAYGTRLLLLAPSGSGIERTVGAPYAHSAASIGTEVLVSGSFLFDRRTRNTAHLPDPPSGELIAVDDSYYLSAARGSLVRLERTGQRVGDKRTDLPVEGDVVPLGPERIAVVWGSPLTMRIIEYESDPDVRERRLEAQLELPGQGRSMAASGASVVVGAPDAQAVFVLERSSSDWKMRHSVRIPTIAADARFGQSVAIDDDTLVVGAPGGPDSPGAVHVFVREETGWRRQAQLAGSRRLGTSVAVSGETAVVGAPPEVYVFVREGAAWTMETRLEGGDWFGRSVGIAADTIVVGAALEDGPPVDEGNPLLDAGAAHVFVRDDTGWARQARLEAADAHEHDLFGYSVAIDGDTIIVGAPRDSSFYEYCTGCSLEEGSTGAAYMFEREGDDWTQQERLVPPDGDFFGFGSGVALSQTTGLAWVNEGIAHVVDRRPGGGVTWARPLATANVVAGAISDDRVVVAEEARLSVFEAR